MYPCDKLVACTCTFLQLEAHQSRAIFTWAVWAPKNWTFWSWWFRRGMTRPQASGRFCIWKRSFWRCLRCSGVVVVDGGAYACWINWLVVRRFEWYRWCHKVTDLYGLINIKRRERRNERWTRHILAVVWWRPSSSVTHRSRFLFSFPSQHCIANQSSSSSLRLFT